MSYKITGTDSYTALEQWHFSIYHFDDQPIVPHGHCIETY
jgi:hypothetical protein